jgi:hypothetical protein
MPSDFRLRGYESDVVLKVGWLPIRVVKVRMIEGMKVTCAAASCRVDLPTNLNRNLPVNALHASNGDPTRKSG